MLATLSHDCDIKHTLCRGNWRSIALAVTECDEVWSIATLLPWSVHIYARKMVLRLFRKSTKKDLTEFSWENFAKELRKEAPTFFQFLLSVAAPMRPQNIKKGADMKS